MEISKLQKERIAYKPALPKAFESLENIKIKKDGKEITVLSELASIFTGLKSNDVYEFSLEDGKNIEHGEDFNVAVILSGGPAPGGHNVIAGIFDAMAKLFKKPTLLGFKGGPDGLLKEDYIKIDSKLIDEYRNTGGFDIIGSGRGKIESDEQFKKALETSKKLNLDALIIIGGDDSNTNACLLADYFQKNGIKTKVVGVPKTIDGDLKNEYVEASFGFDTACKTYSELIGNICRDALSSRKYWHFIKIMGRSASHVALECALKTQVNVTLISEEVKEHKRTLKDISLEIANSIKIRAQNGENFGIVLIPEGLIEFIPEMSSLIQNINDILASADPSNLESKLPEKDREFFKSLPANIKDQLLLERDPHGNIDVSAIETEKLILNMVKKELDDQKIKFSALNHFFGYEGRCAFPSNFDANYCYALGINAILIALSNLNGYMSCIKNLEKDVATWKPMAIPTIAMMNIEKRHGKDKPVIKKALVDLKGKPYKKLLELKDELAKKTLYIFPGALQYFGSTKDDVTLTLALEKQI